MTVTVPALVVVLNTVPVLVVADENVPAVVTPVWVIDTEELVDVEVE